jgi:hypothetical protein
MSGCVLRAGGDSFDVDQFLASSSFRPTAIFRRGERRWPEFAARPVSAISGFNLTVSDDDGDDQGERQVADALAFIERNRGELMRLTSRGDVATCLDFGCVLRREKFAKSLRLPVEIVRECAALGIEIEVSVYADGPPVVVES